MLVSTLPSRPDLVFACGFFVGGGVVTGDGEGNGEGECIRSFETHPPPLFKMYSSKGTGNSCLRSGRVWFCWGLRRCVSSIAWFRTLSTRVTFREYEEGSVPHFPLPLDESLFGWKMLSGNVNAPFVIFFCFIHDGTRATLFWASTIIRTHPFCHAFSCSLYTMPFFVIHLSAIPSRRLELLSTGAPEEFLGVFIATIIFQLSPTSLNVIAFLSEHIFLPCLNLKNESWKAGTRPDCGMYPQRCT